MNWDGPTTVLVIGAVAGAVIAILKQWQLGSQMAAVAAQVIVTDKKMDEVHQLTNSGSDRLKEMNKILTEKLEVSRSDQLAAAVAALAIEKGKNAILEADIVKRADAAIPIRTDVHYSREGDQSVRQTVDRIDETTSEIHSAVVEE